MKKAIALLIISIACLAFVGGIFYQYYLEDRPIIEVNQVVKERIVYIDRPIEIVKEVEVIKEVEVVKEIQTTIFRYPNTPPYEAFPDPINFEQALVLLYGMRASHIQALNWEFESDPGFGIADKDLQEQFIKWYDQLIDIFWRMKNNWR